MFASRRLLAPSCRAFSTVPVKQIASVLKFNVGDEAKAVIMDAHFQKMNKYVVVMLCV
jgi:hypothetical protein